MHAIFVHTIVEINTAWPEKFTVHPCPKEVHRQWELPNPVAEAQQSGVLKDTSTNCKPN